MKRSILTAGAALLLCGKLAAQTPPNTSSADWR